MVLKNFRANKKVKERTEFVPLKRTMLLKKFHFEIAEKEKELCFEIIWTLWLHVAKWPQNSKGTNEKREKKNRRIIT